MKFESEKPIVLVKQLVLVLLFSGFLSIPYLDLERFYFTWFAFVPLLFAIEGASLAKAYWLGTLAGFLAFASGMYWIADFINIAKDSNESINIWLAILNWLYCSQLIAILVVLLNWFRKHSAVHDFVLFPVLIASITATYPMLFSMRLADSQVGFEIAIQATEFFGAYALDAIIALANIMLFRMLVNYELLIKPLSSAALHPLSRRQYSKWPWLLGILTIVVWLAYGWFASRWWESELSTWQRIQIGLIQPNETPQLSKKKVYPGYSAAYPPELDMSERLASIGAEIIIWPEAHPKDYLNNQRVRAAFQHTARNSQSSLLFQDIRKEIEPFTGKTKTHYNSAIMLNQQGQQIGLYNKIKRIPFGEYIPILDEGSLPSNWVKEGLGRFLNQYSKGDSYQLFQHDKVNIVPLICYETTFPEFVADAVRATTVENHFNSSLPSQLQNTSLAQQEMSTSKGTLLVGLSNDGWFGSTHQPYQHIMGSILRAVENRLPLVHVANNGPSIVVAPHGKVIFSSQFQQDGGYIAEVPVSNRASLSLYSRYPYLFTYSIYSVLLVIGISVLIKRLRKAKAS